MDLKARQVLLDCGHAMQRLDQSIREERLRDARLDWFTCITLLRAVGHVLKNIDGQARSESFRIELD